MSIDQRRQCHTSSSDTLCLHERFAAHVRRTPSAMVAKGKSVSHAELNTYSNRRAHRLVDAGFQPDCLIALCTNRSWQLIAGILAILKAGSAHMPLDPDYPQKRPHALLADCAPTLVLTDSSSQELLRDNFWPSMPIDMAAGGTETDPIAPSRTDRHLAYVTYTSGSTGIPKSILTERRAINNRLDWTVWMEMRKLGKIKRHEFFLSSADTRYLRCYLSNICAISVGKQIFSPFLINLLCVNFSPRLAKSLKSRHAFACRYDECLLA